MARNVEIKARATDWAKQTAAAAQMADAPAAHFHQTDTFFNVPSGRLKLREFDAGSAELIQYDRADAAGPRLSSYVRSPVAEPQTLKAALATALGVRAVVSKHRTLYQVGQTRIHLDEVAGLGRFIELEVVLRPRQTAREAAVIAEQIMARLGVRSTDLIAGAYVDLLTP